MDGINDVKILGKGQYTKSEKIKKLLTSHSVTILFVIICLIAVKVSKLPIYFVVNSLVTRITRNSFLVLALLIPVMAGMGLNFSITVGAMAGQIAIVIAAYFGIGGWQGFLLCAVMAAPLAILFGNLTGRLLNKTKGNEMIAGMITGYFANGLYQFLFLFAAGTIIPMHHDVIMLSSGVGIRNTIDLTKHGGLAKSLDNIYQYPFFNLILIISICAILFSLYKIIKGKGKQNFNKAKNVFRFILSLLIAIVCAVLIFSNSIPSNIKVLSTIKVPMVTVLVIGILALFNVLISKTKLGQDFRTVGQDKDIAEVSGIDVNKVRILAITISTVLAAWGQLIFLQNMGVMNTYGSHVQIALFSIAALLVGGASASKATVGQAFLGVILFHTLFIVSPMAGKEMFGDAMIGEFFRAFVAYGVIGVSLGLHAWKKAHGKNI